MYPSLTPVDSAIYPNSSDSDYPILNSMASVTVLNLVNPIVFRLNLSRLNSITYSNLPLWQFILDSCHSYQNSNVSFHDSSLSCPDDSNMLNSESNIPIPSPTSTNPILSPIYPFLAPIHSNMRILTNQS